MSETPSDADTSPEAESQTQKIRALNDQLRQTFSGGEVVETRSVAALPAETRVKVYAAIREFDDFTEDSDPYGEHQMGVFEVDGQKLMFWLDYYDQNLEYGSPDPANPDVTRRVMTILFPEER